MQFSVGVVPQPLRIMQKVAMGYSVVISLVPYFSHVAIITNKQLLPPLHAEHAHILKNMFGTFLITDN